MFILALSSQHTHALPLPSLALIMYHTTMTSSFSTYCQNSPNSHVIYFYLYAYPYMLILSIFPHLLQILIPSPLYTFPLHLLDLIAGFTIN